MSNQVALRNDVILGDFGAKIMVQDLALRISATLTLLFDDQGPIRVVGDITGSATDIYGSLYVATSYNFLFNNILTAFTVS